MACLNNTLKNWITVLFLASCDTDILTKITYVTQGEIRSKAKEDKGIAFL
jgi:hypothetical protein